MVNFEAHSAHGRMTNAKIMFATMPLVSLLYSYYLAVSRRFLMHTLTENGEIIYVYLVPEWDFKKTNNPEEPSHSKGIIKIKT